MSSVYKQLKNILVGPGPLDHTPWDYHVWDLWKFNLCSTESWYFYTARFITALWRVGVCSHSKMKRRWLQNSLPSRMSGNRYF